MENDPFEKLEYIQDAYIIINATITSVEKENVAHHTSKGTNISPYSPPFEDVTYSNEKSWNTTDPHTDKTKNVIVQEQQAARYYRSSDNQSLNNPVETFQDIDPLPPIVGRRNLNKCSTDDRQHLGMHTQKRQKNTLAFHQRPTPRQ